MIILSSDDHKYRIGVGQLLGGRKLCVCVYNGGGGERGVKRMGHRLIKNDDAWHVIVIVLGRRESSRELKIRIMFVYKIYRYVAVSII